VSMRGGKLGISLQYLNLRPSILYVPMVVVSIEEVVWQDELSHPGRKSLLTYGRLSCPVPALRSYRE